MHYESAHILLMHIYTYGYLISSILYTWITAVRYESAQWQKSRVSCQKGPICILLQAISMLLWEINMSLMSDFKIFSFAHRSISRYIVDLYR